MRAGELLQHVELLGGMNDDLTLFFGGQRELFGAEDAFQQKDALGDTRFTKSDGIGESSADTQQ